MIDRMQNAGAAPAAPVRWNLLADRVLAGEAITPDEALQALACPDEELLDLLAAAYRVRRRWFGNRVQLYFLMNAKSGLCPEDCGYCSQSKVSEAEIPHYNLLSARQAARRGPHGRRAAGEDLLHRDLGPRPATSARWRPSRRSCPRSRPSTI